MTPVDVTAAAVERFKQAVNARDMEALAAAITDDCYFESTLAPDGDSYKGTAEVVSFFRALFDTAAKRTFDAEEVIVAGDRAVVRWVHRWTDRTGKTSHVRGLDLFRVRDGKVAESCRM